MCWQLHQYPIILLQITCNNNKMNKIFFNEILIGKFSKSFRCWSFDIGLTTIQPFRDSVLYSVIEFLTAELPTVFSFVIIIMLGFLHKSIACKQYNTSFPINIGNFITTIWLIFLCHEQNNQLYQKRLKKQTNKCSKRWTTISFTFNAYSFFFKKLFAHLKTINHKIEIFSLWRN